MRFDSHFVNSISFLLISTLHWSYANKYIWHIWVVWDQGVFQLYFPTLSFTYEDISRLYNCHLIFILWILFYFSPFETLTEHMQINISHIFQLSGLKGSSSNTFLPSVTQSDCVYVWIKMFYNNNNNNNTYEDISRLYNLISILWILFCSSPFQPITAHRQINISHIFELCWLKVSSNNTFPYEAKSRLGPEITFSIRYFHYCISIICI